MVMIMIMIMMIFIMFLIMIRMIRIMRMMMMMIEKETCLREFGREEHISGRWTQPELFSERKFKILSVGCSTDHRGSFEWIDWISGWGSNRKTYNIELWMDGLEWIESQVVYSTFTVLIGRLIIWAPAFLEARLFCLCPSSPWGWCSAEVVPCPPELWWRW